MTILGLGAGVPVSGWLDSVDSVDTSLVACNGGGCGYEWCDTMPRCSLLSRVTCVTCHVSRVTCCRITIPQFMIGFALGAMGYPFCLTLSASIFSKVVGGSSNPVGDTRAS